MFLVRIVILLDIFNHLTSLMRREFNTASSGGRQGGRRQDVGGGGEVGAYVGPLGGGGEDGAYVGPLGGGEVGAYVGPLGGAGGGVFGQGGRGQGGLKDAKTGDLVPSAGLDGFDGIFGGVG